MVLETISHFSITLKSKHFLISMCRFRHFFYALQTRRIRSYFQVSTIYTSYTHQKHIKLEALFMCRW